MTTACVLTRGNRIAVGQQYRIVATLGDHRGGKAAHHIRAVEVIGDLAKAFGFALGTEHRPGLIQTLERCVLPRLDSRGYRQVKGGACRLQPQRVGIDLIIAGSQRLIINSYGHQFEILAVQYQRRQALAVLFGIQFDAQPAVHQRVIILQIEGQVRLADPVIGLLVVLEVNGLGLFGTHGVLLRTH